MSTGKHTIWRLVQRCAHDFTTRGVTPFTTRDLIACVQRHNSQYEADSINPIIQGITDNLRGGAPGAVGKNILHSVGRGQFVLKDTDRVGAGQGKSKPERNKVLSSRSSSKTPKASEPATEDALRDFLMAALCAKLGNKSGLSGSGSNMEFGIGKEVACRAEKILTYTLPNGTELGHKSDILVVDECNNKYISIELKYKSAVTDQFKCRSYDILHLKKHYKKSLLGVMLFVKTNSGISIQRAEAICYQFDHFFGIPVRNLKEPHVLDPLVGVIRTFLETSSKTK